MQFGLWSESERKAIRISVKREVYKRAKGRCESCRIKLAKSEGDFHHFRAPSISPTAKTVQFLCPTCHRKYGHERKTVAHRGFFEDEKETIIKRKKAPTRKRKTTRKKPTKRKTTKKKKLTKKKTTSKRKTSKRKTAKKKTTTRKKRTTKKKPTKRKKKTTKKKTKHKRK